MIPENSNKTPRWLRVLENKKNKNKTQPQQNISEPKKNSKNSTREVKNKILFGLESPLHQDDFSSNVDYYRLNGSRVIQKNRSEHPCTYNSDNWDEQLFMSKTPHRLPMYKSNMVDYEEISKIPEDKTYVYPILINDVNYFQKCEGTGFSCIHPRVHKDVVRHKAIIVILFQHEGTSGQVNNTDLDILSRWTTQAGFPKTSVIYIHGNLLVSQLSENHSFTAEPCSVFEHWIPQPLPAEPVTYNLSESDNLFLCLNRRARESRTYTMLKLYEHQLFDRGKISYDLPGSELDYIQEQGYDISPQSVEYFRKNPKKTLDLAGFDYNPAQEINSDLHANTFLHLNTETLVDDSTLFMSEKVFKPIVVGQPFLLIGSKGSLAKLHDWGYKTFEQWWDESYDHESDWQKRIDKTLQILNNLKSKKVDELNTIRNEMISVLQHNQEIFLKRLNRRFVGNNHQARHTPIHDIIEKHVLRLCNKQEKNQAQFRDLVEHSDLHERALWVVVDPWEKMDREMANPDLLDSINLYMSHKISSYLHRNKVKNVVILSYLTPNPLFSDKYPWLKSHESLTSYCETHGFNKIVFCGFHNQICIKNIGTEHQKDKSVYLMSELCGVLPRNWLEVTTPSDLILDFSYTAYGNHVIVI